MADGDDHPEGKPRVLKKPMVLHISAAADLIHDILKPLLSENLAEIMSERAFIEWEVYNADLENNYTLIREFLVEFAPHCPTLSTFESAFTLLSINLNIHGETVYHMSKKVDVLKTIYRAKAQLSDVPAELPEEVEEEAAEADPDLARADKLAAFLSPSYDIKAAAVAMEPDLAENAGLPIHPAEAAPVQISYATKAAAADENRKINKKRGRGKTAPDPEQPKGKEPAADDEKLPDAPAAPPARKTRLSKLLKGQGTPSKLKQAGATKNSKTTSPKKQSPRKIKKVLKNLEKVRDANLPGLHAPEKLTNQSFTAYPDKALKKLASPIGIILLAENFYVKKVKVPSQSTPADKKEGCTIPWHLYGMQGGYLEWWEHAKMMAGWNLGPGDFAFLRHAPQHLRIHFIDYVTQYCDRTNGLRVRDLECLEIFSGFGCAVAKAFKDRQQYDKKKDANLEQWIQKHEAVQGPEAEFVDTMTGCSDDVLAALQVNMQTENDPEMPNLARILERGYQDLDQTWCEANLGELKRYLEDAIFRGEYVPVGKGGKGKGKGKVCQFEWPKPMAPKPAAGAKQAAKKKKADDDFDMAKEMSQALQRCNSKLSRGAGGSLETPRGRKVESPRKDLAAEFAAVATADAGSPPIHSPYHKKLRMDSPIPAVEETLRDMELSEGKASIEARKHLIANEDDMDVSEPQQPPIDPVKPKQATAAMEASQGPQSQEVAGHPSPELKSHNPEKSQDQMPKAHNPEKSQDQLPEAHNPEKSQDLMPKPHNPEKSQDPMLKAQYNPEKSQDPMLKAHNPEKSQDPMLKAHNPEKSQDQGGAGVSSDMMATQVGNATTSPSAASPSRAEMICREILKHGLPEPDAADDEPLKLLDYMFREGMEKVVSMSEVARAAQVLKWTRTIGSSKDLDFEKLDDEHGYMAKVLHQFGMDLAKQQATVDKTAREFQKYVKTIKDLGTRKGAELDMSKDAQKIQAQLEQIKKWVEDKIRERQKVVTEEEAKLTQLQYYFGVALTDILDAVEEACDRSADNDNVTDHLEKELQALMLESQGADGAAGCASPRREPLPAVKVEAKPVETPQQTEPLDDEATKEAKRLQHNARVQFDRKVKSGNCPELILEKVKSYQDRLKLMQSLFAEWYEHGGDWLQTSVMQEASRQKVDESRGTEKMTSWKALREKYGKKTAEKIRDNKKRLEAARDPKTEPRPFWFPHPEASEDWEMFRCFDGLEFELKDVNTSTTGFSASVNLAPEMTSKLAPIFQDMMRQPGASSGSGHGGAGLLHSGSREALANQENKQQPTKKVNAYILTRKLNSKIQAIASKLTEIFVWMQKIGECQEKSMSEKTKEGFIDQLTGTKQEFETLKSKMEALYSSCNTVQDKDLTTEQQSAIEQSMQAADSLSTSYTGALKPMKMYLEPPKAKTKAKESFTSARQSLQAMKEELLENYGIKMTGRCAKLEVPIDMVNVPIKPELSLGMATIAAYMRPIFDLHSIGPGSFKWCSMHVINLGVALWVVGSCFKLLLQEFFVWGDGDFGQRLRSAFEARVVVAWLAAFLMEFYLDQTCGAPDDLHWLAAWFDMSEDSSRYLTEEQALGMQRACDKCMMAYCLLAEKAASLHRPLWWYLQLQHG
ncbi:hypothetical protein AK812_SmicGene39841 [Symbiodinium microadriaticum]|uniref:Uncharacterized protein n=1 Tax=Symbiodinium microadriaticum TaxID=2951 RepID=A0A1Q9CA91_SYMMI|nr:hypothetical protein AK812_SmicGene39841 [Symbiodinium microadriaticum]